MLDRAQHVALEFRIIPVALDVGEHQLQLRDQVLQVVHDECRQPVEGVELARLEQRLGCHRIRQVACRLATGGLQQVADLPVDLDLDARTGQHDVADQFVGRLQGHDQPGFGQVGNGRGQRRRCRSSPAAAARR